MEIPFNRIYWSTSWDSWDFRDLIRPSVHTEIDPWALFQTAAQANIDVGYPGVATSINDIPVFLVCLPDFTRKDAWNRPCRDYIAVVGDCKTEILWHAWRAELTKVAQFKAPNSNPKAVTRRLYTHFNRPIPEWAKETP